MVLINEIKHEHEVHRCDPSIDPAVCEYVFAFPSPLLSYPPCLI